MITVFNRRELTITMSMEVQSRVRDILSANGIDYIVRTKNLQASPAHGHSRGQFGTLGIDPDYSYEYKIYVHRNDYDRAQMLVQNHLK